MPLTREDFIDDAELIGCDVETIMAVARIESRGSGFDPDGFPITLFEGHWFSKYTKGKYDKDYPTISYPRWTKQHYGRTRQQERQRLELAMSLDRNAAILSSSWGMFQIMGFNFSRCGFKTVQQFVNAMCKSENAQLEIFTQFILNNGLADELRDRRWADFARLYNGPQYAQNQYDIKLAKAYDQLTYQA